MDKNQAKILRTIKRKKQYKEIYVKGTEPKFGEDLYYLLSLKYLSRDEVYENTSNPRECTFIYKTTPLGRDILYAHYRERRRWFIPVIISIVAAIGGYRRELALVIQAALQLLQSIMGSLGI